MKKILSFNVIYLLFFYLLLVLLFRTLVTNHAKGTRFLICLCPMATFGLKEIIGATLWTGSLSLKWSEELFFLFPHVATSTAPWARVWCSELPLQWSGLQAGNTILSCSSIALNNLPQGGSYWVEGKFPNIAGVTFEIRFYRVVILTGPPLENNPWVGPPLL